MKNTPITENHLYQKAYAKGRRAVGKYVAVYALRDRQAGRFRRADPCRREVNRLGLTVGKKLGGAVVRNRAKRLMREAYRLIEKDGGVTHGYLLVIAARSAINGVKTPQVRPDLERALRQLGMLQPASPAPSAADGIVT